MRARDIMTTDVLTVGPEDGVNAVAGLLLYHRISAVPVVDDSGQLCGIVSVGDLIRRLNGGGSRTGWLVLLADRTSEFTHAMGTRARDVMTREVVSVEDDTPMTEIAGILEERRIKSVPVMAGGHLVGIVSRADVLRGVAALQGQPVSAPTVDDRRLQNTILETIARYTSTCLQAVSVIVVGGVVYLWGIARTEADKDAIRVAAERVAGIDNVHDFLSTMQSAFSRV